MSEWFKEHDWKSCVGLKPTGGSNPLLCAKKGHPLWVSFFGVERDCGTSELLGGSCERIEHGRLISSPRSSSSSTLCCRATICSSLRLFGFLYLKSNLNGSIIFSLPQSLTAILYIALAWIRSCHKKRRITLRKLQSSP